jgi:hypothetical protein
VGIRGSAGAYPERIFFPSVENLEIRIFEGRERVVEKLEDGMILPLAERNKPEIIKVVRHEQVLEEIAGALPIVGPTEYLKGVYKAPSIWVKLGGGDI